MNIEDLKYCGIHKRENNTTYFFPSEYDAVVVIRQTTECVEMLKRQKSTSTLRTDAPVFAPVGNNGMHHMKQNKEEEKENEQQQFQEEK